MKIKRQATDACQYCEAPKHCVVAEMGVDGQSSLSQESVLLKKGEILYHQQEKSSAIYLIKSGAIKTYWLNEQGDQTISDFFLSGELLGFSSVNSQQYVENAQALRDTELCRMSLAHLLNRLNEEAAYQITFLNLVSASLARVEKMRYCYLNATAVQKVAFFLLDYTQRLETATGGCLQGYLLPTQQDIANYLGLSAETLSRIMTQLQRNGLVHASFKQIVSLDGAKLQALTMSSSEN